MARFSERLGLQPVKSVIQLDTVDEALRTALWNQLTLSFWESMRTYRLVRSDQKMYVLLGRMWVHFFNHPLDTLPDEWQTAYSRLRDFFFTCEWYEVYDFVEFVADNYPDEDEYGETTTDRFRDYCNQVLERELAGYRFVGRQLAPISSKEEMSAVEEALIATPSRGPVHKHLRRALELLAERENPDFRNSIKESISAVEALCRTITGDSTATLGTALKQLEQTMPIHPALKGAFEKLYGYTSNAGGIRHALLDESTVDLADAKFMLVSCAAFTNYLLARVAKAGIELDPHSL